MRKPSAGASAPGAFGAVVGALVGAVLGVVWIGLRFLGRCVIRCLRGHRRPDGASPTASRPAVEVRGRDYSDYEPSIPRCLRFPGVGYLTLWAFQGRGVVMCQLVITRRDLAATIGAARVPMEEMPWPKGTSLEVIEDAAVEKAKSLLKRRAGRLPASELQHVDAVRTAVPAPAQASVDVPAAVPSRAARKPAAKPYVHMPTGGGGRATRGVLRYAGMAHLVRDDGKATQHFAADIEVPGVGVSRIWGVDLQRALGEADAWPGDTVEIVRTGRSLVPLPHGGMGKKNHFAVRVLK